MSTDHIVHDAETGKFLCEACGVSEAPPFMPAPINVIVDAMDHFMSQHEACADPAPETVMSDYIKGFDDGYDYVLREIEQWQLEFGQDLSPLLKRLRMETIQGRETT
jgi:hypothetical protein